MEKYLCIGGTRESREICDFLIENNSDFILSVATEYGRESFDSYKNNMVCGKMDQDMMQEFVLKNKISVILDFSHPFARDVSINAINCAKNLNLTYIRYERPSDLLDSKNIIFVKNHDEACNKALGLGKNVFLTVGSNNIDKYVNKGFEHVYARVLPRSTILKKLEDLDIKSSDIIAMQGPFTFEMNCEMLKKYRSNSMISKESGDIGGFKDKIKSCEKMEIPLIVIRKPDLTYPRVYSDINMVKDIILKGGVLT